MTILFPFLDFQSNLRGYQKFCKSVLNTNAANTPSSGEHLIWPICQQHLSTWGGHHGFTTSSDTTNTALKLVRNQAYVASLPRNPLESSDRFLGSSPPIGTRGLSKCQTDAWGITHEEKKIATDVGES